MTDWYVGKKFEVKASKNVVIVTNVKLNEDPKMITYYYEHDKEKEIIHMEMDRFELLFRKQF